MLIKHENEKLINAIIYFLQNTNQCGKTKLMKLLYLLDFEHFSQIGKSVTGLDYYAWEFGPVPEKLWRDLTDKKSKISNIIVCFQEVSSKFQKLKARKDFDSKYFSDREFKLLKNIAYIYKDARADDMVKLSHLPFAPWDMTIKAKGEKQKIDYMLALESFKSSLPKEEVEERIADRHFIQTFFNG
ncbi:MAG: Panacea domain-containing protein [Candidatus Firestonebacteria bacterium]